MNRQSLTRLSIPLAIVAFVALNIAVAIGLPQMRLDATADRLYTLTKGTHSVIKEIKEPITLRLFATGALLQSRPELAAYAGRVRAVVSTYVRLSGGQIRFEEINVEPASPEEDRASAAQLTGVPLNQAGDTGYFGLVGSNMTDDQAAIALLSPERESFLEYDITQMLNTLNHPQRKTVGVIDSLGITGTEMSGYQHWAIIERLRQAYEVKAIEGSLNRVPPDVDVLLVVHPRWLDKFTLDAIDQYALSGKPVMVFTDPNAEVMTRGQHVMAQIKANTSSDFPELFKSWGIEPYDRESHLPSPDPNEKKRDSDVVADRKAAIKVQGDSGGRQVATDYVVWLAMKPENFDTASPITGRLNVLNFMSAGAFRAVKDAKTKMIPLVKTSSDAMVFPRDTTTFLPEPLRLLAAFQPTGQSYPIAVQVTGTVKSAYPNFKPRGQGDPPARLESDVEKAVPQPARLTESAKPLNVIAVADVDFLADSSWVQRNGPMMMPFANNSDFVLNAIEALTGGVALNDLRGRGVESRPFERIEELRRAADKNYRAKEQQLMGNLNETQRALSEMKAQPDANGVLMLTPEQQDKITQFQSRIQELRRDLREVRYQLRGDIEALTGSLARLNIFAMPLLIIAFGLLRLIQRRRRVAAYRKSLSEPAETVSQGAAA